MTIAGARVAAIEGERAMFSSNRIVWVLAFVAAGSGVAVGQWGGDTTDQLRWEYQNRRREIILSQQQARQAARHEREQALFAIQREEIGLNQLCPQERAAAHQVLAARRRDVHEQFHCRTNELNRQRQVALLQLDQWYDQARSQLAANWSMQQPGGYSVGYGGYGHVDPRDDVAGYPAYGPATYPDIPRHRTFTFSIGNSQFQFGAPSNPHGYAQPIVGWPQHNRLPTCP